MHLDQSPSWNWPHKDLEHCIPLRLCFGPSVGQETCSGAKQECHALGQGAAPLRLLHFPSEMEGAGRVGLELLEQQYIYSTPDWCRVIYLPHLKVGCLTKLVTTGNVVLDRK